MMRLGVQMRAKVSKKRRRPNDLGNIEQSNINPEEKIITWRELSMHNGKEDGWIAINGYVYRLKFLALEHPGGEEILYDHAGQDVTGMFTRLNHSEIAKKNMKKYLIGKLENDNFLEENDQLHQSQSLVSREVDVLVIGAGITGASACYYLTQMESKKNLRVTVLEDMPLGGGTGLKSSAIMWTGPAIEQTTNKQIGQLLTLQSLEILKSRRERVALVKRGTIGIFNTEKEKRRALALFGPDGKYPYGAEFLEGSKLCEREPCLGNDLLGGSYHKNGYSCDPYLLTKSFIVDAEKNGATFKYNTTVTGLSKMGEYFHVHTEDGLTYRAPKVLICTGWKAMEMAKWRGHDVPVQGVHGQMVAVKTNLQLTHQIFSWEALAFWEERDDPNYGDTRIKDPPFQRLTRHFYGQQIQNGVLKIGGDRIKTHLAGDVLDSGTKSVLKNAVELMPKLKDPEVLGVWSGTMPFTPDLSIITSELEDGLFVSTGTGVMRGAACGRLLAKMVLKCTSNEEKKTIHECRYDRFKKIL